MMVLLEYDTRNFLSPSEISGFHGEVDENMLFWVIMQHVGGKPIFKGQESWPLRMGL